jgi:hypothetical protein
VGIPAEPLAGHGALEGAAELSRAPTQQPPRINSRELNSVVTILLHAYNVFVAVLWRWESLDLR